MIEESGQRQAGAQRGARQASVMMMLGDFAFSIDTTAYNQLTREASWRWSEQERISGFGSREDRSWVVESLVFSLTPAGFSYTYNLVVDIRRPAKSAKKSGKDKNGPDYFG